MAEQGTRTPLRSGGKSPGDSAGCEWISVILELIVTGRGRRSALPRLPWEHRGPVQLCCWIGSGMLSRPGQLPPWMTGEQQEREASVDGQEEGHTREVLCIPSLLAQHPLLRPCSQSSPHAQEEELNFEKWKVVASKNISHCLTTPLCKAEWNTCRRGPSPEVMLLSSTGEVT